MVWTLGLPVLAAVCYAWAAVLLRRVSERGGTVAATAWWVNVSVAAGFLPWVLLVDGPPAWGEVWRPVLAGGWFIAGQVLTLWAIAAGAASLQTPMMGTKVVFVALLAAAGGAAVSGGVWAAVGLTLVGVVLLGWTGSAARAATGKALALSAGSALMYAAADVVVAGGASRFGEAAFLVAMFATVGVATGVGGVVAAMSGVKGFGTRGGGRWWGVPTGGAAGLGAGSGWWMAAACGCFVAQALAMGSALAWSGDATVPNVVYALRGVLVVAIVWGFGRWLGIDEHADRGWVLARRLLGAMVLVGAVAAAVWG